MLPAFNVPVHFCTYVSVGFFSKPATLILPVTLYGFSLKARSYSLYSSDTICVTGHFYPVPIVDLYIQRASSVDRLIYIPNHRYFMDFRHIGYDAPLGIFRQRYLLRYSLPTSPSSDRPVFTHNPASRSIKK